MFREVCPWRRGVPSRPVVGPLCARQCSTMPDNADQPSKVMAKRPTFPPDAWREHFIFPLSKIQARLRKSVRISRRVFLSFVGWRGVV